MDKKRILIIDDNFELALFLRTTLEIVWPAHEVVNVPSGEEGLLEVRRGPADVIILDLKLPGIHGLEFLDKVERLAPGTPIIAITGERSPEVHQRVQSLGLAGFFLKPLHVDDITSAVRQILEGDAKAEAAPQEKLSPQIARRLSALRIDTGAEYVMFVDLHGRILAADGRAGDLNTARLAALLAKSLVNSAELARVLNAPRPFTITYQAGTTNDLYAAAVGGSYVIVLTFDARYGRGKIGAVWVYVRRAIKELLGLLGSEAGPAVLPAPPVTSEPEPVATPEPTPVVEVEQAGKVERKREGGVKREVLPEEKAGAKRAPDPAKALKPEPAAAVAPKPEPEPEVSPAPKSAPTVAAASKPSPAAAAAPKPAPTAVPPAKPEPATPAAPRAVPTAAVSPKPEPAAPTAATAPKPTRGARTAPKRAPAAPTTPKPEPEPAAAAEDGMVYTIDEIDAFWDSVLSEETRGGTSIFRRLTYEEARARGLIPDDFEPE